MAKNIYGDFYNPTKLISTGKALLACISPRSYGKSTGWFISILIDYLRTGHQFIYVRRTEDELDTTAPNVLNNPSQIINNYYKADNYEKCPRIEECYYKSGKYYVNGKVAGFAVPLSLQQKRKSDDFSGVWWIIYDEFLVSAAGGSYLGGAKNPQKEIDALLSLFMTVDRGIGRAFRNECRIVLLGNNEKYNSPIFHALGIDKFLTRETNFLNPKSERWALEQVRPVKAVADFENSNAYALSTEYNKQYAFGGLVEDDSAFIGKPSGKVQGLFNFHFCDTVYGVGILPDYTVYVRKGPYSCGAEYAFTRADHSPNYMLVKRFSGDFYMSTLRDAYTSGQIMYDCEATKYTVDTFFAYA